MGVWLALCIAKASNENPRGLHDGFTTQKCIRRSLPESETTGSGELWRQSLAVPSSLSDNLSLLLRLRGGGRKKNNAANSPAQKEGDGSLSDSQDDASFAEDDQHKAEASSPASKARGGMGIEKLRSPGRGRKRSKSAAGGTESGPRNRSNSNSTPSKVPAVAMAHGGTAQVGTNGADPNLRVDDAIRLMKASIGSKSKDEDDYGVEGSCLESAGSSDVSDSEGDGEGEGEGASDEATEGESETDTGAIST